ncbi:MAG TPA: carotenoid biosynthesis protein [Kutzneria sp.]
MSVSQRLTSSTTVWAVTAIALLGSLLRFAIPAPFGLLPLLVSFAFVLLHGARRYGWPAIAVYVVVVLLVSNILENLSISTGFPFGHYHYTDGGKIFQVPWFIGIAYASTGYLAWIVGTVLIGEVRRGATWLATIGTPVVASFAMVAWDLSLDPAASTINQIWIWEHSGGFFGVPLVNFLGWSLTVYLFLQIFALYLHARGPQATERPQVSDFQAVLLYAAITVGFFVTYATAARTVVTDAVGQTWHTADIYETSALTTVYGLGFIAVLAFLRIAQRRTEPAGSTPVAAPADRDRVLAD